MVKLYFLSFLFKIILTNVPGFNFAEVKDLSGDSSNTCSDQYMMKFSEKMDPPTISPFRSPDREKFHLGNEHYTHSSPEHRHHKA